MDRARYVALQEEEWKAMQANPILLEVTAEEWRDWKFALILLRRIRDNTKDSDLTRVEQRLQPLLSRVTKAFAEVPEVKASINAQRELLGLAPLD